MEEKMKKDAAEMISVEIIRAEIPIVEKIVRDETWLAGERRGCEVHSEDPEVLKRVCSIINRHATEIAEEARQKAGASESEQAD